MRTGPRFNDYREIVARFDSIGACGHPVKKGDDVGYNRRGGVQCAACWRHWCAENAEADACERGGCY
jgi:hypothetical protein